MVWKDLGENPRPPPRKQIGKDGRKIHLTANFFEVKTNKPNTPLTHYDVVVKEHYDKADKGGEAGYRECTLPKWKKMEIFESFKKSYPKIFASGTVLAYDQEKNAYSVGLISQLQGGKTSQFEVNFEELNGKIRKFMLVFSKVAEANLNELLLSIKSLGEQCQQFPTNIFQMLEIFFRHNYSVRYNQVGRNSFFPKDGSLTEFGQSIDVGGGKEGLVGFFSSLRPAQWKNGSLLLNVDVANTTFYKEQSVLDFLYETLGLREGDVRRPLDRNMQRKVGKELHNLKVVVTHTKIRRTYRVSGVGDLGADRHTFKLKDGSKERTCSVQNYFKEAYKMDLKYPAVNCLIVGPKDKGNMMPMEVCRIAKGQKVAKKLTDRETAAFIRNTAIPPRERLQRIQKIATSSKLSQDAMMKALSFTVSDMPMRLEGRVIAAPTLGIGRDQPITPKFGVWEIRNRGEHFHNSATITEWAVVNYDDRTRDDNFWRFIEMLQSKGAERGMNIADPIANLSKRAEPEKDFNMLKKKHPKLQLIFVVLGGQPLDLYARIKKVGDREVGIISQCVRGLNVNKGDPATVANILLKINAKMEGTNNILKTPIVVFGKPVMIMGADVNHPPAQDTVTPSLAGVVASMDKFAAKYAVQVRHQTHRREMITDLREMTVNLLKEFKAKTRVAPDRIIMYRDGVSESQFMEVLSYEMKAMRDACTSLSQNYKPAITFIVVQKRHHTRLFCDERDGVGRSKNIPPGTTVDHSITHPSEMDFYLCSHQGIQGTSKPSHYHVLWDDSDLTMDQLQSMTYALCHLYSRCNRSVSIPTPAYYAHLVAFRAKTHLSNEISSDTASVASGHSGEGSLSDAQLANAVKMDNNNNLHNRMYFV